MSTTGSPTDSPLLRALSPQPNQSINDKPISPTIAPTAAKRKVMSFFSSLKQSNSTNQSTDQSHNHVVQPVALRLSLLYPEPELVPHVHSPITATFEPSLPTLVQPIPQPTGVTYRWSRVKENDEPIILPNTSATYVPSMDDIDGNIRCETTVPTPDQSANQSITITEPAKTIGPINLSPAFVKASLQPFQSNSIVVSAVDATDSSDVSITIRRTSIRITAALSGQTKHSFRISSSNSSLTVSIVAEDNENRTFILNDSKTERMFKARCVDTKQRDRTVYLLKLLLTRPDFVVANEIAEIEKIDADRQRAASEAKALADAETAQAHAELQKAADDAKQAAAAEQLAAQEAAHAPSKSPEPSAAISNPSNEQTSAPIIALSSPTSHSPQDNLSLSLPTVEANDHTEQSSDNIVEVLIYPFGHHQKMLASSNNDAQVAQLKQQIAEIQLHMQSDAESFSMKLEAAKSDRHNLVQERQALIQAHEAQSKKQSEEIARLQHELSDAHADFESLKKSNSSTLDEITRQHAEVLAAQTEEAKRILDKVTNKATSIEQALRKELDLYKREVARLKEKEARVDVLEMENHRLGREHAVLSEEYNNFKSSINAARTTSDSAVSELQEQKARYDNLLESVTSERDRFKAEVEELNEQAIELADQLMSAESAQVTLTAQVEEMTTRLAKTESELAIHSSSSSTLQAELETARARIDQLESEANYSKKQQQTLRAQIERFIKSQAQFKQQIKESESFLQESKDEITSLRVENANLLNRIAAMEQAARQAALIDSGHASAGSDAVSAGAQALQIDALKSLCNRLTEQINDQDTALVHLKRTNQILGVRVKELEERFADQLVTPQSATNGKQRR